MASASKLPASELPDSIRQRVQALTAASEPLAIEGDDAHILGYIVSPEQLQRLLEDAYTERLLDEVHGVVQEVRAERAAEQAYQHGHERHGEQ